MKKFALSFAALSLTVLTAFAAVTVASSMSACGDTTGEGEGEGEGE